MTSNGVRVRILWQRQRRRWVQGERKTESVVGVVVMLVVVVVVEKDKKDARSRGMG